MLYKKRITQIEFVIMQIKEVCMTAAKSAIKEEETKQQISTFFHELVQGFANMDEEDITNNMIAEVEKHISTIEYATENMPRAPDEIKTSMKVKKQQAQTRLKELLEILGDHDHESITKANDLI
jgi:C4-type Zn-finger protein